MELQEASRRQTRDATSVGLSAKPELSAAAATSPACLYPIPMLEPSRPKAEHNDSGSPSSIYQTSLQNCLRSDLPRTPTCALSYQPIILRDELGRNSFPASAHSTPHSSWPPASRPSLPCHSYVSPSPNLSTSCLSGNPANHERLHEPSGPSNRLPPRHPLLRPVRKLSDPAGRSDLRDCAPAELDLWTMRESG